MNGSKVRLRTVLAVMIACMLAPTVARPAAADQAASGRRPMWQFAVSDDSRAAGSSAAKNNGVAVVVMSAIAKDISAQGVDFVLFPGDMVTGETNDANLLGSELDTWIATTAPIYDAGIPVYTTRGNHEYDPVALGAANPLDPSRQTYLDHFEDLPRNGPYGEKGLTYAISHKNVKVIGFDQYAGRGSSYDNTKYAPCSNHGQAVGTGDGGYLLITVYSDNTWSGEFRGFHFNSWNTADVSLTPITVMDTFDSSWAAQ